MSIDSPSDAYLIEKYNSGDKSTLVVLVRRWHKTFCDRAFWILKDKDLAKDIAQESWVVIINKLHTLNNAGSFKSWALRIIYTKSIDAHKRRAKETRVYKGIDKTDVSESIELEDHSTSKRKLYHAIQELSKDKQDIIRLYYLEEYSLKEIASFLEIPIGTVKSRLFKAREKLKSILISNGYEK